MCQRLLKIFVKISIDKFRLFLEVQIGGTSPITLPSIPHSHVIKPFVSNWDLIKLVKSFFFEIY